MAVIVDMKGRRVASAEELERLRLEADTAWDAFWTSLVWRPIDAYDRAAGDCAMLRNGDAWDFGYWGEIGFPLDKEDFPHLWRVGEATWRHVQDYRQGVPLGFEPTSYAEVSPDQAEMLTRD